MKTTYIVTGTYTMEFMEHVEAESEAEAIEKFKKIVGRPEAEYKKVEYEVETDFLG